MSLESRLKKLLETYNPQAREKVQRAFKQWNLIARDYLRTETGLRLTVGEDAQAVPVRIQDGMPLSLAQILEDFEEYLELLLILPQFEAGAAGTAQFERHYARITSLGLHGNAAATREEVARAREFADNVVARLKEVELLKKLTEINEDVLGAYFFHEKRIDLYWMPIALFASLLGVRVEALTVVVTAHELAHAYSHLGRDIDGLRWDTAKFEKAEAGIVEGLAQFYTSIVCQKLELRYPAALEAYEKLLERQGGAYVVHKGWAAQHPSRGEVVRISMIKCRTRGQVKYKDFLETVGSEAGAIKAAS